MKTWCRTDVEPLAVETGTGTAVMGAAKDFLRERNGGLPPNLHMANRGVLLRTIRELHDEVKRLRATQAQAL